MSQENVEIVRRAFAEFERGNFWVPEFFDPEMRVIWAEPMAAGVRETENLGELSQGIKAWLESFEEVTMGAERIIDAGDRVVVIAAWRGRGKASGADVEWHYGAVCTLRDGKLTSLVSYSDPAEALEAVGLSEQDAHASS
jgi:ketosteroid isomerase-like protein